MSSRWKTLHKMGWEREREREGEQEKKSERKERERESEFWTIYRD